MNMGKILAMILVSALCTFSLRALPFAAFCGSRKMPVWLENLGQILPSAIMAVLIVYCLKDVATNIHDLLLPKLAAVLLVIGSYKWKHNTLLSIVSGTAVYMLLLRLI